jgi:hypothetical protein
MSDEQQLDFHLRAIERVLHRSIRAVGKGPREESTMSADGRKITMRPIEYVTTATCAISVYTGGDGALYRHLESSGTPAPVTKVVGTGFLIAPHLVVTNRHVMNRWITEGPQAGTRLVEFLTPTEDGKKMLTRIVCPWFFFIDGKTVGSENDFDSDIAVLDLSASPVFPGWFDEIHRPVAAVPVSTELEVGAPIVTVGYPFGNDLLFPGTAQERFGPIATVGFIAAQAPYGPATIAETNYLIGDLKTAWGMSGSPVFFPNGRLLGMHWGGTLRVRESGQLEEKLAPHGFAYILPLPQETIERLVGVVRDIKALTPEQKEALAKGQMEPLKFK